MSERPELLVFRDQAGDLYLLPAALLDACRLSNKEREVLERLSNERADEVEGHLHGSLVPGYDPVKGKLDSLQQLGGTEAWRQQMALDHVPRQLIALNNLLGNMTATSNGITQNLR